jgi:tetratricopeptide (TPR) repeat protein
MGLARALEALEAGGLADDARVTCLRADLEEANGDAERALDLRLACVARMENERQFEGALEVLNRILARNEANIALLSRKANLLRALGRVGQAVVVYLEIVDLFRASDELENATGIYQTIIDLEPEEMEHRRRQLDLFLKLGPEPVVVQKTLEVVALCVERGQAPEASRLLERALEAAPESAELLWKSGALYEQCGRRGEAAERCLAAGQLLARRHDNRRAREAFERALRCVPEHLEAREGLANALLDDGQALQAIGILRDLAGFFLREHDGAGAIRLCRRVLEVDPEHVETLAMLAEACEVAGDVEQALATRMRLVDMRVKAQDWGKATALCEEVLARHEDYLPAMERLVSVAEATRQGEHSIRGLWQLAQAHQRAGHVAEEQDALERVLKNDPFHAGAWRRRLDLQARQTTPRALATTIGRMCEHFEQAGRLQDGIDVLEGIVQEAESPKPEAFAGLARLCRAAGDQAGLRRALRSQAELLGRMVRDGEALAVWDELASLEPDNHAILRMRIELMKRSDMFEPLAEEHRRLARALIRTGHDRQAQVALLEAIAIRPLDVDAREELIELMIRRGDRLGARTQIEETAARLLEEDQGARAIALYERILVFDPEDAPTYRKIIAIHQRLDDLEGAMAAYERLLDALEPLPDGAEFEQAALDALQLDPKHDRIRRRLAHVYALEGRRGEAETLLLTLVVGRLDANDLDAAEDALDQLLSLNPTSVPGRAQRAQLLARRGQTDDALKEFMSLTGQLAKNDALQMLAGNAFSPAGSGRARLQPLVLPYEGIPLLKEYTFDNFIIGERNNFAHAAAMAACRAPGKNYNPLFLYADVGLGKTHLCHAIAHYVRDHYPEMKVRYDTMEEFVTSLIDAIGAGGVAAFRSRHKVIDVLIVDDVQFLSGKEQAQEEFFHVFNALYQAGKQVVLTSDRPPKDIERLEKRLKSRFGAGIIVDIQAPDLETRVAILRHELTARGCHDLVDNDALLFIAEQAQANVRELKGAINQVLARHEINGEKLDLPGVRKILEQSLAEAKSSP